MYCFDALKFDCCPVQSVTELVAPVTTSPTSSPSGWPPSSRGTCSRGQSARPSRLETSGAGSPGAGSARGEARGAGNQLPLVLDQGPGSGNVRAQGPGYSGEGP